MSCSCVCVCFFVLFLFFIFSLSKKNNDDIEAFIHSVRTLSVVWCVANIAFCCIRNKLTVRRVLVMPYRR
jgi:heme/copper-type cytochrome/quinol oxidase subunit 2